MEQEVLEDHLDIAEGKGDWVLGPPMFYYAIKEDAKHEISSYIPGIS